MNKYIGFHSLSFYSIFYYLRRYYDYIVFSSQNNYVGKIKPEEFILAVKSQAI